MIVSPNPFSEVKMQAGPAKSAGYFKSSFDIAPEALNMVYGYLSSGIFSMDMVNSLVSIAASGEDMIARIGIGVDHAIGF